MIAIGVLLGLLVTVALLLILVLLRRGNRATENADGLLIEQARRIQAHHDRLSYNARTMHDSSPTMSDNYRP